MGGMLRAIETGYVQREIQEAAYNYQRAVETNDAIVVGVNKFRNDETETFPILRIVPESNAIKSNACRLCGLAEILTRPHPPLTLWKRPQKAPKIFFRESSRVSRIV